MAERTIKSVLGSINSQKILLPALQRKFVWSDEQIEKLFDSVLQGYPIGTFIFWKVSVRVANKEQYTLYKFLQNYDESDKNNEKASSPIIGTKDIDECEELLKDEESVEVVLDGQQRLTALLLSLQGTITRRIKNIRRDEYIRKELYINLRKRFGDGLSDKKYNFKMLSDNEINAEDTQNLWYKVKNIVGYNNAGDCATKLMEIMQPQDNDFKGALELLTQLYERLVSKEVLGVYVYETNSMDDVLEIFVRVNAGGTKLSRTDLLFSTIVSRWEDAREKIEDLIKDISKHDYDLDSDFIMRVCLYLIGVETKLSVRSLSRRIIDGANIDPINVFKKEWDNIKDSFVDSFVYLKSIGLTRKSILSMYSIIPIIYYRYKRGKDDLGTQNVNIRKYIVLSNLLKLFGRSSDTTLGQTRIAMDSWMIKNNTFPSVNTLFGKSINAIDEDLVNSWMEFRKDQPETRLIMTLLYPDFDYRCLKNHIDHMHPKSSFSKQNIVNSIEIPDGYSIDGSKKEYFKNIADSVPNLQVLEGEENADKKKSKSLLEWVNQNNNNRSYIKYIERNNDGLLDIKNFISFYNTRKNNMVHALVDMLVDSSELHSIIPLTSNDCRIENTGENVKTIIGSRRREPPFRFSMCKIDVGDYITWYKDDGLRFKVHDDRTVEYNGQFLTLSALAAILLNKASSAGVRGPDYFKFRGTQLTELRESIN